MTDADTQQCRPEKDCGTFGKINYCFWAKLLVAIPALPCIALIAAAFFTDPLAQQTAAVAAIIGTVCLAVWIDRLPALQKKVVNRKQK
jgi:hypothetical protein